MNTDKALNPAWTGQLAHSLRIEHGLAPEANARIKRSLMQKIAEQTHPTQNPASCKAQEAVRNVRRGEGWVTLSKRMQVKVLHDDGTSLSWLLRLLPGGGLPVHDHADGAEECMILEGSLRINGELFQAGDYQIALPGSVHHEVASEEGSLVYLRSPSSRRKDLMGA
jgi:quercetin dioxygenase-like cupin family protein